MLSPAFTNSRFLASSRYFSYRYLIIFFTFSSVNGVYVCAHLNKSLINNVNGVFFYRCVCVCGFHRIANKINMIVIYYILYKFKSHWILEEMFLFLYSLHSLDALSSCSMKLNQKTVRRRFT